MKPVLSYLICTTSRSGSYMLCEALELTKVCGNPEEAFWKGHRQHQYSVFGATNFQELFPCILKDGTTFNGVFGAKVFITEGSHAEMLQELRTLPQFAGKSVTDQELMSEVFPNLHYIFLTRRDKIRQAVSLSKAMQTDMWTAQQQEGNAKPEYALEYSRKMIDHLIKGIVSEEAEWQEYFRAHGAIPFVVVYEDFVERYEDTALELLDYLGIPEPRDLSFAARATGKQADTLSEEWYKLYMLE